jgi:hypothetical protein
MCPRTAESQGRSSLIGRLRKNTPATVRKKANALAAHNRHFEAIALLSASNRSSMDAETEVLLVRLRHQAFAQVARSVPTTTWPPELPDPFPNVTGQPPEIEPSQLTADVLGGALLHHGCLLVRGLVSESQALELIEDTDRSFRARRVDGRSEPPVETRPWFVPFDPEPGYPSLNDKLRQFHIAAGAVLAAESPRSLFHIIEAYEQSHVIDAIEGYLGERPAISLNKCVLRHTAFLEPSNPTWHQDGAFLGAGVRTVDAWLSLSQCGGETDTPGLEILPRRLDEILDTGQERQASAVTRAQVDAVTGDTPVMRPLFAPGDGLLFDERFLHRTGIDPGMSGERRAIETWFFAPSSFPKAYIPIAL